MTTASLDDLKMQLTRNDLLKFLMIYKFAIDEVNTKINILNEEFKYIHDYNPIENISSRVKSSESILQKAKRKKCELSLETIKENIKDIAGIRITCSFISDVYAVCEMLQKQKDIEVIEYKDYIKYPKPNGYQSLHMIIKIPVFMSDSVEHTYVEVQIRTIAMDFWASLEHKIYYKFNEAIPEKFTRELKEAALSALALDKNMERIHKEVNAIKGLDTRSHIFEPEAANSVNEGKIHELLRH
ncbi:GTP pyrophosphokinase family protein [Planomicrobium sp. CPCC 101110]|uniref:GTP pyrophosphokinase n=1 Tax=Planomicrobium sp. CPCC 101110 TaxID=2599619 RepID=UPI0011B85311|nr:GTP pyrophosphokinase family protein [Planomicrobium sp. CPCC 101110]TWT25764.1 GTP pyrophosphokinase family protein [Planomicrobium sp. CPCC 101110]